MDKNKKYISRCLKDWSEEYFSDNICFGNKLDICRGDICAEEPETYVIENVRVQIYSNPRPFTLEKAENAIINKYFGDMSVESQDYGYSEYTIEGFNVYSLKIGNHDLIKILNSIEGYKILVIERV